MKKSVNRRSFDIIIVLIGFHLIFLPIGSKNCDGWVAIYDLDHTACADVMLDGTLCIIWHPER